MATTFHRLTVRDVEPLTDDSAAVPSGSVSGWWPDGRSWA